MVKITGWSGEHEEAIKLVEDFLRQNPEDLEMKIFQAEVNLWAKKIEKAIELYLPLVKKYPQNPAIAKGFANAAAKSTAPLSDEAQVELLKIVEKATAAENKDALLVARAAEALATKMNDAVRARQLALKAAAMDPQDPIVRREIAYVLSHPKIALYKEADAFSLAWNSPARNASSTSSLHRRRRTTRRLASKHASICPSKFPIP